MAVRAVDVEAKQDFAPARPLGVRFAAYVNKPAALDVLGDDHPLPAQLGDHRGHDDEWMAPVLARQRAVIRGLELVVELLGDALGYLLGDLFGVEAGREAGGDPKHQPQVLQVGADDIFDAGVLHLDGHRASVVKPGAEHLADRCGGDRLFVELGERGAEAFAEILLDHLAHVLERHTWGHRLQLSQLGLKLLPVRTRHHPGIEHRQRLPDLHRRSLHSPKHLDDAIGHLEGLTPQGVLGLVRRAASIGDPRSQLSGRGAGGHATETGASAQAGLVQAAVGHISLRGKKIGATRH